MAIKAIKIETLISRVLLVLAGGVFLTAFFFFAAWSFANAIGSQAVDKEIAEITTRLAPSDPQTHYALASLNEQSFVSEDLPKSLAEYETATALSPHDYRLWLAFGKARERNGDRAGAELALRKAGELAPNYAEVQWALGNTLLRIGKTVEGFANIRRAAESDVKFANPAISTAWQFFDGDAAQIKQNLGDSAKINSALAVFLAKEKRFDEALEVWKALPAEENKTAIKQNGEELFKEMLAEKRFRDALEIQTRIGETAGFAPGKVFNGGFEANVATKITSIFEWQIAEGLQPQIGFDNEQKHGGNRSLVIVFNSFNGKDFRGIGQVIAVEPRGNYKFEAFYKSDLKTSATLKWEIVDASSEKILATTEAINAVSDWKSLRAEFIASENTQAVVVRLARENCKAGVCSISGKVWFDDFSINQ